MIGSSRPERISGYTLIEPSTESRALDQVRLGVSLCQAVLNISRFHHRSEQHILFNSSQVFFFFFFPHSNINGISPEKILTSVVSCSCYNLVKRMTPLQLSYRQYEALIRSLLSLLFPQLEKTNKQSINNSFSFSSQVKFCITLNIMIFL